ALTANCATCHDHKFDPITTRDFYSLSAFFNNSTQGALDGNIRDTPPILFVPARADRPRWEALSKELKGLEKQLAARKAVARPDFDKWLTSAKAELVAESLPSSALSLHASLDGGAGQALTVNSAGDYDKH